MVLPMNDLASLLVLVCWLHSFSTHNPYLVRLTRSPSIIVLGYGGFVGDLMEGCYFVFSIDHGEIMVEVFGVPALIDVGCAE